MAEVSRDDEGVFGVGEIGRQELAVEFFGVAGDGSDEDGHDGYGRLVGAREHLVDVGEVHFEAVFGLVGFE